MWQKIRFFLSPLFLQRFYLTNAIKKLINNYQFRGSIIDIGCGSKPYQNLFINADYQGIDFAHYSINKDSQANPPDYFFTKQYQQNYRLPFANNHFNHAVAFQVLEHHPQPEKMIAEMSRIIKKGGYLLLSFPLIGGLHEEPHDYQRLTHYQIQNFSHKYGLKIKKIIKLGSLPAVISVLLNEQLGFFASKSKWHYYLSAPGHFCLLLGQYLALLLDKLLPSKTIFIGYLILLQK